MWKPLQVANDHAQLVRRSYFALMFDREDQVSFSFLTREREIEREIVAVRKQK